MTQENGSSSILHMVSTLHQLVLESVLAKNGQELIFRMLNRTVGLCRYDRALFFQMNGKKSRLRGISGQGDINRTSEKVAQWTRLAEGLRDPDRLRILFEVDFKDSASEAWRACTRDNGGTSVVWLPLKSWGGSVGGLWLERWSGVPWTEQECKLLSSLALGYGGAWERLHPKRTFLGTFQKIARKKRTMAAFLLAVALLMLFRLPLRVVAPCEVVPEDPFVVTAPLNGVVEDIRVHPGDSVTRGQLLFVYDKRVAEEELNVAREQVEIIESSLDRARMQAFADPRARSDISILEHRLKQEHSRLELAKYNVSRLEVRAETDGTAELSDPEKWRGRPVSVGERVLSVVDPQNTKVRIQVPEDDNMDFNLDRPAKILLNVFPETAMSARINYVSSEVTPGPQSVPGVQAEAQWIDRDPRVKIGLKGSSVLYGENVSLAYWLFRKPWAAFNNFFGI